MPCRTPSLCRQAAQNSSQCLWITDDVLAEAWNRFARVSRAHKARTESRRYGSNVPGPLEARRRLAKRRMGMAAAAPAGAPAAFDWGALFGLGGFFGSDKVGRFDWQAPGKREAEEKESRTSLWLGRGSKRKDDDAWASFLNIPGLERPAQPEQPDPVDVSRTAFESLLQRADHSARVGPQQLQHMINFLQSSANEAGARNTLRLVQWLVTKDWHEGTRELVSDMIVDKVRLGTLDENEATEIIASLALDPARHGRKRILPPILDALVASGDFSRTVESVTHRLLEGHLEVHRKTESLPNALKVWLECLRTCQHLHGQHWSTPEWHSVYQLLSTYIPDMTVLADHLSQLRPDDLARLTLRYWVPHMIDTKPIPADVRLLHHQLLLLPATSSPIDLDLAESDFEALRAYREIAARRRGGRDSTWLTDMMVRAWRHGANDSRLGHALFTVITHDDSCWSPDDIYHFVRMLGRRLQIGIDIKLAARAVHYFLDVRRNVYFAYKIFENTPGLPLSYCYNLPIIMAETGAFGPSALWKAMQRHTPRDRDYFLWRDQPANSLRPDHVDLIHLVAREQAKSSSHPPRVAFRRVWECYLFLSDRRAPINSLMSRAMVHAGIIRPFKEGSRVGPIQVQYILSLVAEIEGIDVAEALDRAINQLVQDKLQKGWQPTSPSDIGTIIERGAGSMERNRRELKQALTRLGVSGDNRMVRSKRFWLSQRNTPSRSRSLERTCPTTSGPAQQDGAKFPDCSQLSHIQEEPAMSDDLLSDARGRNMHPASDSLGEPGTRQFSASQGGKGAPFTTYPDLSLSQRMLYDTLDSPPSPKSQSSRTTPAASRLKTRSPPSGLQSTTSSWRTGVNGFMGASPGLSSQKARYGILTKKRDETDLHRSSTGMYHPLEGSEGQTGQKDVTRPPVRTHNMKERVTSGVPQGIVSFETYLRQQVRTRIEYLIKVFDIMPTLPPDHFEEDLDRTIKSLTDHLSPSQLATIEKPRETQEDLRRLNEMEASPTITRLRILTKIIYLAQMHARLHVQPPENWERRLIVLIQLLEGSLRQSQVTKYKALRLRTGSAVSQLKDRLRIGEKIHRLLRMSFVLPAREGWEDAVDRLIEMRQGHRISPSELEMDSASEPQDAFVSFDSQPSDVPQDASARRLELAPQPASDPRPESAPSPKSFVVRPVQYVSGIEKVIDVMEGTKSGQNDSRDHGDAFDDHKDPSLDQRNVASAFEDALSGHEDVSSGREHASLAREDPSPSPRNVASAHQDALSGHDDASLGRERASPAREDPSSDLADALLAWEHAVSAHEDAFVSHEDTLLAHQDSSPVARPSPERDFSIALDEAVKSSEARPMSKTVHRPSIRRRKPPSGLLENQSGLSRFQSSESPRNSRRASFHTCSWTALHHTLQHGGGTTGSGPGYRNEAQQRAYEPPDDDAADFLEMSPQEEEAARVLHALCSRLLKSPAVLLAPEAAADQQKTTTNSSSHQVAPPTSPAKIPQSATNDEQDAQTDANGRPPPIVKRCKHCHKWTTHMEEYCLWNPANASRERQDEIQARLRRQRERERQRKQEGNALLHLELGNPIEGTSFVTSEYAPGDEQLSGALDLSLDSVGVETGNDLTAEGNVRFLKYLESRVVELEEIALDQVPPEEQLKDLTESIEAQAAVRAEKLREAREAREVNKASPFLKATSFYAARREDSMTVWRRNAPVRRVLTSPAEA